MGQESFAMSNGCIILFTFCFRFRPAIVKEVIHNVLQEKLTGITYNQEESTDLSKQLGDEIKSKLKGSFFSHIV